MNGCYAQDGDHDWSDSCTCSLPAHPCRLEINSLSTTSKNEDIRGDHSSSSSFNPNTIRFLLSPRRREQEPDCVWVKRGLKRTESFSEAIILSPFFDVCRLNPVSDQKAAQSFEYRRFVMLFGSSRVYRSKKNWVEKNFLWHEVCGHALLTIVGKSQILHE